MCRAALAPVFSIVTPIFNNTLIFHQHTLRKTISRFVFNNFCSGLKVDIFSTCVFNNFCRHTFIFNPRFLGAAFAP